VKRLPPYRFKICGRTWRIRYGDPTGEAFSAKEDWGVCVSAEQTIYLNPTLRLKKNRDRLWETFAHEVMHAIDFSLTGRGMSHAQIHRMEVGLGPFLYEMWQ
jgi:hypothetical protein